MKKLLPLIAVGVCVASWASPGNVKTNVTLMADWDTNLVSSDLSFNLYGSSNIAVPMANWTLLTNVTYPACMTNDTNILIVLPITPGQHYYFLTASNWFGESFPSNTTNALIVGKINNLKISPGP